MEKKELLLRFLSSQGEIFNRSLDPFTPSNNLLPFFGGPDFTLKEKESNIIVKYLD